MKHRDQMLPRSAEHRQRATVRTSQRFSTKRRGIVAAFVGVTAIILLGMAALAVDLGYVYVSNDQMQAAVDAAALAGASGAPHSEGLAVGRAHSTGVQNIVAGRHLAASELGVEVGYWHGESQSFSLPTGAEWAAPNAARVVGNRPGVALFFANVLGHATTDVTQDATAIYGGGRCAGIWGLDGVDGDGSLITDSYDSSAGPYGPGNTFFNGDICSDQDIVLEGSVTIGGDAMYGEGFSLTTFGSSYSIYGVTTEHTRELAIPPIDMVAAAATNDNATIGLTTKGNDPFGGTEWDFVVTGNDNLTLNGGTFFMTSALVSGKAILTITAPTTFYISGPATFTGGGIVNATLNPKNLIIYSTGATMTIDGDDGFYGVVIAPETTVTFTGNSDIYGSVLAGFLQLAGDTMIHVDSNAVQDIFALGPRAPVLVE